MLKIKISLDDTEKMLHIARILNSIAKEFDTTPKAGGEGKEREKTIQEATETEAALIEEEKREKAVIETPPHQNVTARDHNGVARDPRYCTETILKTGPMKGQWRKKGAVSQEEYDAWYSGQMQACLTQTEEAPASGSLFAETPVSGGPSPLQSAPTQVPQTAGELCKWVSIHTAAGLLTVAQVDEAYRQSGTTLADLVSSDPHTSARKCAAVHAILFNAVSKA